MNVLLALALVAPAQNPKSPKEAPKAAEVPGFGLPAESEFYWPTHLLIASPDVQKELKITKEQVKQLEGIQAELKKAGESLPLMAPAKARAAVTQLTAQAEKGIAGILTEEQRPRHRQILWQVLEFNGGVRGQLNNPVFAKEVGLSANQQQQAKKLDLGFQAAWMQLVRANPVGGNGPVPGEDALMKKFEEASLKLLTADQKKKWNELLGEPFKGDIVQFLIPGLRPVTFKAPEKK